MYCSIGSAVGTYCAVLAALSWQYRLPMRVPCRAKRVRTEPKSFLTATYTPAAGDACCSYLDASCACCLHKIDITEFTSKSLHLNMLIDNRRMQTRKRQIDMSLSEQTKWCQWSEKVSSTWKPIACMICLRRICLHSICIPLIAEGYLHRVSTWKLSSFRSFVCQQNTAVVLDLLCWLMQRLWIHVDMQCNPIKYSKDCAVHHILVSNLCIMTLDCCIHCYIHWCACSFFWQRLFAWWREHMICSHRKHAHKGMRIYGLQQNIPAEEQSRLDTWNLPSP